MNIKRIFKEFKKGKLLKGSLTLGTASIGAAIGSYFYYFFMGHMLSPEEYGTLYVLISITYFFVVFNESIRSAISKFTTKFFVNKEYGKIKDLLMRAIKKLTLYGLILIILILIFSPLIGNFLQVSVTPIFIVSLILLISLILPVTRGILQGMQKFKEDGLNFSFEAIFKVFFGVFLVFLGLGVNGALFAIFLSLIFCFLISFFQLKEIIKSKKEKIETKEIYGYSFKVFFGIFLISLMYIVDVIIAKKVFSPTLAGYYAVISTLGKIILFISSGVSRVMFPLVSEEYEKGKKSQQKILLYKTLIIVLIISLVLIFFYSFFPKTVISLFFGNKYNVDIFLDYGRYMEFSDIIKYMAFSMMFLSLSYVICIYNLSINKKRFIILTAIALISEIIFLILFHRNLMQFIRTILIINILLFLALASTLIKINLGELAKSPL